jgi:quinol monooxygenase YgiN
MLLNRYASREDMESHVNSEAVQKLIKKLNEDGLLTAPPLIKIATGITGFTR